MFEIGKFYKHSTGHCLHIVADVDTTLWGKTLVAEVIDGDEQGVVPIDRDAIEDYKEITEEEWMEEI